MATADGQKIIITESKIFSLKKEEILIFSDLTHSRPCINEVRLKLESRT